MKHLLAFLKQMIMIKKMIYVHIPFCESKCYYCNFCSGIYTDSIKEEYFKNLINEIVKNSSKDTTISSIYIGGGTPSCVDLKFIKSIINSIINHYNVLDSAEITIEANPCSTNLEKLKTYKELGINRISFGVQSLNNKCLKLIGRKHDKKSAIKAIKLAKQAGFDNISCDILIGIPNQTYFNLKTTVKKLLNQNIKHISCYMLINEEGTILTEKINKNLVKVISEDKCVEYYNRLVKYLNKNNFYRYEISNFSQNGYESKHNLGYWNMCEYYGFGLSAHSYLNGNRLENTSFMNDYLNGTTTCKDELLSNREKVEELIMLGLRTSQGVKIDDLNMLGFNILLDKKNIIDLLQKNGFICCNNEYIKIQDDHFGMCNNIILKLLP